ncbi:MAG: GspH/FimT family pseudopilin [Gammaproteobacteria bacterium]|nr:GspH/FimT family pseudopilin [Gammaproteobacteria bacterium]
MPFFLSDRCATHLPLRIASFRQARGFTLLEVMVVVAILAILAALASPSFTPLIERWRVRDAAESLTSTLYFARSEAIKRGGNIIIAKNPNTATCTTATADTEWGCGWRVFFDANGNGAQDACILANNPNECDLQTTAAPTRLTLNLANSTGSISADRWGMLSHAGEATVPTNMFFELMPKGKTLSDASAARLCTGTGGRVVRKKGSETC